MLTPRAEIVGTPLGRSVLCSREPNPQFTPAWDGRLDPEVLARLTAAERFPAYLWPVFQILLHLQVAYTYLDGMLKENGSHARRFARPFVGE